MSATYTYFACDLRTDRTLAELPLGGVSFEYALNETGEWKGTLDLSADLVKHIDPHNTTTPGKTCLWVQRDNQIVYGGPIWSRRYRKKQRKFELGGHDFISYLKHRNLFADKDYSATDIMSAAADVIDYHANVPHGNILLEPVVFSGGSPVEIAGVSYLGVEAKKLFDIVADLGDMGGGFDFAMDFGWVGERRKRQISLHHPYRGRPYESTRLIFDNSNIEDYDWPEDGTDVVTEALMIGAGEGNAMLRSKRTNDAAHEAGYPLLQKDFSYKDVNDQGALDYLGDSVINLYDQPYTEVDLDLKPGSDPAPGTFVVGDWAEVRIKDERFPSGITVRQRIISITITPPEKGKAEAMKVKLGGPQERIA